MKKQITSTLFSKSIFMIGATLVITIISIYTIWQYIPKESGGIFEITPATGVDLLLYPSTLETSTNIEKTISIRMNTSGLKVTATKIELTYDPNDVSIVSVNKLSLLPNVIFPPTISNGLVKLVLVVPPESDGQPTSGAIARVRFKTLHPGTFTIAFGSQTAATAIGYPTSILRSTSGVTINSL